MASGNWKELTNFYDSFGNHETWKELEWMKKFVVHLIKNRDLQNLNYFTSHEILCVTKFKTHSEWYDKPFITVEINWGSDENYKYKFSLIKRQEKKGLMRESVDSVFCSFNKSLEVFDEMVGKLGKIS